MARTIQLVTIEAQHSFNRQVEQRAFTTEEAANTWGETRVTYWDHCMKRDDPKNADIICNHYHLTTIQLD